MWNNKKQEMSEQDDESWEIRAFEEDTVGNLMGCTWPPRSYSCTFCRREFRSAQALGGHMNVHRRDRARMHDNPPGSHASPPSSILIPTQEFLANGGLCFLYTLPSPNVNMSMPTIPGKRTADSLSPIFPTMNGAHSIVSSVSQSNKSEPSASNSNDDNNMHYENFPIEEELDLELRLGCKLPSETRVDNNP